MTQLKLLATSRLRRTEAALKFIENKLLLQSGIKIAYNEVEFMGQMYLSFFPSLDGRGLRGGRDITN